MLGFSAHMIETRLGSNHQLVKVYHLLDWDKFSELLSDIYKRKEKVAGVKPYEPVKMFRAMILQAWHSLSDPKMEEALKVRLDFMWFVDFDVSESVPDETSICRFRNRLVKQGLDAILFAELNRQLAENNIMVEAAQAAIVDASIIESAAKPKQTIEPIPEDRKEDETETVEVKHSADPDAAWLKKGRKSTFGYKLFAVVDENGFVRHMETTPANQSEVTYFEPLIDGMPQQHGMRVYSDKGNASKANRDMLKQRGLKDGIMHKAARNKPLTAHQKRKNKLISKIRYIVEQDFGIMKNRFGFSRASYFGVDKVHAQGLRKMMCLNLKKAANMIEWISDIPSKPKYGLLGAA